MIFLVFDVFIRFPETYKEKELDHPCFLQAKQEFDAVHSSMNSAS